MNEPPGVAPAAIRQHAADLLACYGEDDGARHLLYCADRIEELEREAATQQQFCGQDRDVSFAAGVCALLGLKAEPVGVPERQHALRVLKDVLAASAENSLRSAALEEELSCCKSDIDYLRAAALAALR